MADQHGTLTFTETGETLKGTLISAGVSGIEFRADAGLYVYPASDKATFTPDPAPLPVEPGLYVVTNDTASFVPGEVHWLDGNGKWHYITTGTGGAAIDMDWHALAEAEGARLVPAKVVEAL